MLGRMRGRGENVSFVIWREEGKAGERKFCDLEGRFKRGRRRESVSWI